MTDIDATERALDDVAALLARAANVLFVTGAGISADSGLPTYRGVGGLYHDESTEDGVAIEEALSGEMLRDRPELTWKYIAQIEAATRGARPNRAHHVIAALESKARRVCVLTQNVDGFHARAGSSSVLEIHGNLHRLRCTRCPHRASVRDYAELAIPPSCPKCGAIVRPDVVLFGEMLPTDVLRALEKEVEYGFDLVVIIGTTAAFPYIAHPVVRAAQEGIPTVEINPGHSAVTHFVRHHLAMRAATALDAIATRLRLR